MQTLKQEYNRICIKYLQLFCDKQGMEFDYWLADQVGGVASFGDYFFNFLDIKLDIDTSQPKGEILRWYSDNLEYPEKLINYYSYTKGLSVHQIKK